MRKARRRRPASVGIREAKAQLSALVKRAAGGEDIQITDRGKPVARLVGPEKAKKRDPLDDDPGLRALMEAGYLTEMPPKRYTPLPPAAKVRKGFDLQLWIRQDRDSRG